MGLLALLVPLAVIVTVAVITSRQLRTRSASVAVNVGVVAVAADVLLAAALTTLAITQLDLDYGIRCDWGGSRVLLGATYWMALALGGIAYGALAADRWHRGRAGARHVLAGLAVGVITLVLLVELVFVGLGCYGR